MNDLQDITRAIGRLEGKVDGINNRLDRINGSLGNHDDRINDLESSCSSIKGQASILGILGGIIVSAIVASIKFFK